MSPRQDRFIGLFIAHAIVLISKCEIRSYYKAAMKAIEGVQRRATKLIPALKNNTYKERLSHLKLPSLAHRRRRGDMIYTYKIITGKFDINKETFFERSHLRTRGHKYKIYKEHGTKLSQIKTFSNRIVNDWNELPVKIVEADSINSFKNKLDKHWKKYTRHHFIKHWTYYSM